ncbi:MAG TPA: UDP-N-acetylmuramoyl-L-alanine--D-glutamate ligase [Gemmatimonadaceae bacterium]|nr:UDP-N-acetylmuramoyl-L-alanine--D-glutamate ligase [Gemmatimonadaceae bacterium]
MSAVRLAPLPPEWAAGEIAVIGLGKSGVGAAMLLARAGARVYASDAADGAPARQAAERLAAAGIAAEAGTHDLVRIARAAAVVASPGVPPGAPPLHAARQAGVPVVSEVEVAIRLAPGPRVIAVTGTNGKTTTTALIGHLLRALGSDAVDAGNIGTAVTEIALRDEQPDWLALEMSSFQLHDTPSIAPAVGVVTNLAPDHLDRYDSIDDYYADKAQLFQNAVPTSSWVLNADDPLTLTLPSRRPGVEEAGGLPGHAYLFSLSNRLVDAYYDRAANQLVVLGEPVVARGDVALLGDHNVANALAALLAVMVADDAHAAPEARRALAGAVRSFRALGHRLEPVGEFGGVLWINDSKATNVSSTLVAIEGMTRPTIVLLGGRHKGEPYTALIAPLQRSARRVLAYGEAGERIAADLGALVQVEKMGTSFEEVMARARDIAEPGDAVLLSPACSSYDMFRNYEERGAEFRRLAAEESRR